MDCPGTIILNFSSVSMRGVDAGVPQVQVTKILTTEAADFEDQYRALVALANVVYALKLNKPLDFDVAKLRHNSLLPPLISLGLNPFF